MKEVLKKMWLLPLFICTLLGCITLTACGDDDKDEPENPTPNKNELLIIGEWSRNESASSYYRMVFLDDGTGYDKVMMSNGSYNIDETFNWSINGSNLSIIWEGSGIDSYTIVSVTAKELIIRDNNLEQFTYYTRIN